MKLCYKEEYLIYFKIVFFSVIELYKNHYLDKELSYKYLDKEIIGCKMHLSYIKGVQIANSEDRIVMDSLTTFNFDVNGQT